MKLHIENITININHPQPVASLTFSPAIGTIGKAMGSQMTTGGVPAIGEKWPGLEAIYAGTTLDADETGLVHLIVWLDNPKRSMEYVDAVEYAEGVNPEMGSHLPTRHQSITLFERLADRFEKDYWHWTLKKTKSGKTAFTQYFYYGTQDNYDLSAECRVRAVSEIPL